MEKKTIVLIAILVIATSLLLFTSKGPTMTGGTTSGGTAWQEANKEAVRAAGLEKYTANTEYYDYDNQLIADAAKNIASRSSSPKEAVVIAADYVYTNVQYVVGEADNKCFDGTAPEILTSGRGQCDTQSITLISILRKMGIPATPAGGCLVFNSKCEKFAVFAPGVQNSFEIDLNQTEFSRGFDLRAFRNLFQSTLVPGIGRYGGLHAWVMAYVDGRWIPIEATTGSLAEGNCYTYHVELYPTDSQKDDICITKNFNYANACKFDNLEGLDKYGLGLVNNTYPGMN